MSSIIYFIITGVPAPSGARQVEGAKNEDEVRLGKVERERNATKR